MSLLSALRNGVAAAMLATNMLMPPVAGQRAPLVVERFGPEYDGLGHKKSKPGPAPRHNAKRQTRWWRAYALNVLTTHSNRPDPRDDKYLHAHARRRRAELAVAA